MLRLIREQGRQVGSLPWLTYGCLKPPVASGKLFLVVLGLQFGKKLQAAMTRKLQESDVTTQWSLTYKLNSKLRMQFNITSAPPFPKTLMFQFSSEGAGST